MTPIAYLLDENVDPLIQTLLERQWPQISVRRIGEVGVPARGTPDPDILLWCEAQQISLVTNNRKSMPAHIRVHLAAGQHTPGIFILRSVLTLPEAVEELALIWGASDTDEYRDRLVYLPIPL